MSDTDALPLVEKPLEAAEAMPPEIEAVSEAPKKRGRPRKSGDEGQVKCEVEGPKDVPMPSREGDKAETKSAPSPAQAFKLDGEMIGYGVSALFGVIATTTQHNHWLRTPEQCKPISDPLQRLYSRLPAAKKKKVLEYLDPGVLLAGIYQVAGPSIAVEVELAKARRQGVVIPSRPRDTGVPRPMGTNGVAPPPPEAPSDPGKIAVGPTWPVGGVE